MHEQPCKAYQQGSTANPRPTNTTAVAPPVCRSQRHRCAHTPHAGNGRPSTFQRWSQTPTSGVANVLDARPEDTPRTEVQWALGCQVTRCTAHTIPVQGKAQPPKGLIYAPTTNKGPTTPAHAAAHAPHAMRQAEQAGCRQRRQGTPLETGGTCYRPKAPLPHSASAKEPT